MRNLSTRRAASRHAKIKYISSKTRLRRHLGLPKTWLRRYQLYTLHDSCQSPSSVNHTVKQVSADVVFFSILLLLEFSVAWRIRGRKALAKVSTESLRKYLVLSQNTDTKRLAGRGYFRSQWGLGRLMSASKKPGGQDGLGGIGEGIAWANSPGQVCQAPSRSQAQTSVVSRRGLLGQACLGLFGGPMKMKHSFSMDKVSLRVSSEKL